MKSKWYLGETKEYDKFKYLDVNREIMDSNVKKLEKDILKNGLQVPIVVNEDYEIIDGQHRFIALRRNKMVVVYIINRTARDENIATIQESRKWTALDFCNYRAKKGDLSCMRALEVADDWYRESQKKMSKLRTVELLMDGVSSSGLLSRLKKGTYAINEDCANVVYDAIQVMADLEMGTTPYGQKIIRPLKSLYHDFQGLDMDVIYHMTDKNFIKAYSNENDQLDYMRHIYGKSKKDLNK